MRIIRPLIYILLVPAGAFLLFLLYASVDDYKPEERTSLLEDGGAYPLSDSSLISLLIWNIGYAGLDASMDFFYDGGAQMRPTEEGVNENLEGIKSTLGPFKTYDFVLLQEVDNYSKRSYHVNQVEAIGEEFQPYEAFQE